MRIWIDHGANSLPLDEIHNRENVYCFPFKDKPGIFVIKLWKLSAKMDYFTIYL